MTLVSDVAPRATVIMDGENVLCWYRERESYHGVIPKLIERATDGQILSGQSRVYLPEPWFPDTFREERLILERLMLIKWVPRGPQAIDHEIIRDLPRNLGHPLFLFSGDGGYVKPLEELRRNGADITVVSGRNRLSQVYRARDFRVIILEDLLKPRPKERS